MKTFGKRKPSDEACQKADSALGRGLAPAPACLKDLAARMQRVGMNKYLWAQLSDEMRADLAALLIARCTELKRFLDDQVY